MWTTTMATAAVPVLAVESQAVPYDQSLSVLRIETCAIFLFVEIKTLFERKINSMPQTFVTNLDHKIIESTIWYRMFHWLLHKYVFFFCFVWFKWMRCSTWQIKARMLSTIIIYHENQFITTLDPCSKWKFAVRRVVIRTPYNWDGVCTRATDHMLISNPNDATEQLLLIIKFFFLCIFLNSLKNWWKYYLWRAWQTGQQIKIHLFSHLETIWEGWCSLW